jgi:hypothetical protein
MVAGVACAAASDWKELARSVPDLDRISASQSISIGEFVRLKEVTEEICAEVRRTARRDLGSIKSSLESDSVEERRLGLTATLCLEPGVVDEAAAATSGARGTDAAELNLRIRLLARADQQAIVSKAPAVAALLMALPANNQRVYTAFTAGKLPREQALAVLGYYFRVGDGGVRRASYVVLNGRGLWKEFARALADEGIPVPTVEELERAP